MPINFQPAEPLSPSISEGYGAAEQFDRSLPTMQRYQQGIADAYLQGAALRQRATQASSALQLQGAEQTHALDQRTYEANLHAQIQQQQMAHQSDMQAQHAQLQDQLAANQLSRGEQLRLQRLQEARGQVQDMVNTGSLTADEGRATLTQIQTGIDPLQQRQHRAQIQAQEFQYRQAQQQAARQDQLWNEQQQYHASSLQDRLTSIVDPMTGERHQFYQDQHGNPHLLFEGGARGSQGAMASGAAQQATGGTRGEGSARGGNEGSLPPAVLNTIIHQVESRMDAERTTPPGGEGNNRGPTPPWANDPAQWIAERDRRVRERVRLMTPPAPPVSREQAEATEYQRDLLAARRADPRATEQVHQQRAQLAAAGRRAQREQRAADAAPLVPNAREHEGDRAFTGEEVGRMAPAQAEVATGLNTLRELLGNDGVRRNNQPLDAERRANLSGHLNQMQRIVARYGTLDAMPPAERRRYEELRATLTGLAVPRPAPPQAQTPEFFNRGMRMVGESTTVPGL